MKLRYPTTILGAALITAVPAQARLLADFQFNTPGDTEGWAQQQITGLTSDGASLTGTHNGIDPKLLYNPDIAITPGASWDFAEVRVRLTDPVDGVVTLSAAAFNLYRFEGTFDADPTVVDSGDGFFTLTFDMAYFNSVPQGSDGVLGLIRFDIVGGAAANGDFFEVDYIQVFDTAPDLVPGDADGDGDVDDTDLGIAISNFTGPVGEPGGKTLAEGDTDGDGDVDDTDLGVAISGFTGPLGPAAVPEPASLALLGLGGLLAARRRRA